MDKLIPIRCYEDDMYIYSDGTCLDILKIVSKDWKNAADIDREYDIARWTKFYRMFYPDVQIVALNFKYTTSDQQEYVKHITQRQKNPYLKAQLERKLKELQYIEQNYTRREFFLFIFGCNKEELEKNRDKILDLLKGLIDPIDFNYKQKILFKVNNKNASIR